MKAGLLGGHVQLFSQSDRHFVWLAMANMHVVYHTSRAYWPSLSESWLAGRPRAALFSKWSTFRVISNGEHARYVYMTCMFAIAKWKLACWAAAYTALCSSTSWNSICTRPLVLLKFGSLRVKEDPDFSETSGHVQRSGQVYQLQQPELFTIWVALFLAIRDENSSAIRQVWIKLNQ